MSDIFTVALNHYFDHPLNPKLSKTAFAVLHKLMRSIDDQLDAQNKLEQLTKYLIAIKNSKSASVGGAKKNEIEEIIDKVFSLNNNEIGNSDLLGLSYSEVYLYFAIIERCYFAKLCKETLLDEKDIMKQLKAKLKLRLIQEKLELEKRESEKREELLSQMSPIEQSCYRLSEVGANEHIASEIYRQFEKNNNSSEKVILAEALRNYYQVIGKWETSVSDKQKHKNNTIAAVLDAQYLV